MFGQVPPQAPDAATAQWAILRWSLTGGIMAATALIVATWILSKTLREELTTCHAKKICQGLPAAAAWKYTDSWASNLTGLTAAFGAIVLAFSDNLSGVFRPGASAAFAVTSVELVAIAASAPLAYTLLQRYSGEPSLVVPPQPESTDKRVLRGASERWKVPEETTSQPSTSSSTGLSGSSAGLLTACWFTLVSVFGALFAIAALLFRGLIFHAALAKGFGAASLALVGILVAGYAARTIKWLLLDALQVSGSGATLGGVINVSCCESEPGATTRRFSLL